MPTGPGLLRAASDGSVRAQFVVGANNNRLLQVFSVASVHDRVIRSRLRNKGVWLQDDVAQTVTAELLADRDWMKCIQELDDAKKLDPAGEERPEVQELRQKIVNGTRQTGPKPGERPESP